MVERLFASHTRAATAAAGRTPGGRQEEYTTGHDLRAVQSRSRKKEFTFIIRENLVLKDLRFISI